MRHFALELEQKGYQVHYTYYDAEDNQGSLAAEVAQRKSQYGCEQIVCTFPGEYRVHQDMLQWSTALNCPVEIRADDRFIATIEEFATWANGKKQLRMEFFYREMRRKLNCLMHDGQPEGGKWNYDADNRAKLPKDIKLPQNTQFKPDAITLEVVALVKEQFSREQAAQYIYDNARRQTDDLIKAGRIAKDPIPYAEVEEHSLRSPLKSLEQLSFIECGGEGGRFSAVIPRWVGSQQVVSVAIEEVKK